MVKREIFDDPKPAKSAEVEARPFRDIPSPDFGLTSIIKHFKKTEGFTKIYKLTNRLFTEHGPIFRDDILFGGQPAVHTIDPDDFEKVFRSEGRYPRRPPIDIWIAYYLGTCHLLEVGAHLNTLFHSKTGNLIRREEYSKSFDEDVITRLDEAKQRVNSELKYLNEKLDQCKDTFRGVTVEKHFKKKITETEQKEEQKKETEGKKTFLKTASSAFFSRLKFRCY